MEHCRAVRISRLMRLGCVVRVVVGAVLLYPSASSPVSFVAPCATRGSRWNGSHRARRTPSMTSLRTARRNARRLIVDTDLGPDDLVALAILRLQQCVNQSGKGRRECTNLTNFRLHGVTLTPGISRAAPENAALLRRLLPPNTLVYVGEDATKYRDEDKPAWWGRTADQVSSFLESLPPATDEGGVSSSDKMTTTSAEEFIAGNVDDPNVDILCMAPLSTVARALRIRRKRPAGGSSPGANFYVMGGIRADSKATKRGESTSPLGHDRNDCDGGGELGEFNFALDIEATREVLSSVSSARIIPLEACTFVPDSLRSGPPLVTLASMLSDVQQQPALHVDRFDPATNELAAAQSILLELLHEFGTKGAQWDSILAAIYCNVFDSNENSGGGAKSMAQKVNPGELEMSELGALSFPGCGHVTDGVMLDDNASSEKDPGSGCREAHHVYPNFTTGDESRFFLYLLSLLNSR